MNKNRRSMIITKNYFEVISIIFLIICLTSSTKIPKAFAQYPPPPGTPSNPVGELLVYLPLVEKTIESQQTNFHAQVQKRGVFYGVYAKIFTAAPVIREWFDPQIANNFSYASINIVAPNGGWVETGWFKGPFPPSNCIPKFSWATQEGGGAAHIIDSPVPTIGMEYQYQIEKISDGYWRLWIMDTNGYVIFQQYISNPGMNSGDVIQAVGEVGSINKINEMGVSTISGLLLKDSIQWSSWNGWSTGVVDIPYNIDGVLPDVDNNVVVYGNNSNPVPPDAACP